MKQGISGEENLFLFEIDAYASWGMERGVDRFYPISADIYRFVVSQKMGLIAFDLQSFKQIVSIIREISDIGFMNEDGSFVGQTGKSVYVVVMAMGQKISQNGSAMVLIDIAVQAMVFVAAWIYHQTRLAFFPHYVCIGEIHRFEWLAYFHANTLKQK